MIYGFRSAREKAGLSMKEVAERLGVSHQAVSYWETGHQNPSLKRLLLLAELYNMTVDELIKGQDPPPPSA